MSISRLPTIRIGVVPLAARVWHGPMSTFVAYDARMVTVELFSGLLMLRDPKDVDHYRKLFDFFSEHALWGDEAMEFLGFDCRRLRRCEIIRVRE